MTTPTPRRTHSLIQARHSTTTSSGRSQQNPSSMYYIVCRSAPNGGTVRFELKTRRLRGPLALILSLAGVVAGCTATAHGATEAPSVLATPASPKNDDPGTSPPAPISANSAAVPRFDHIVVVVMENRSNAQIIGSSQAPFLN